MSKKGDNHFNQKDIQTHLKHILLEDYLKNWSQVLQTQIMVRVLELSISLMGLPVGDISMMGIGVLHKLQ